MTFLDIWEQTTLTEFIKRRHSDIRREAGGDETLGFDVHRILPMQTTNGRHVKLRVRDILPVGLAQFKAPGATPALWTQRPRLREEVIEIVDIDEFHRVDPIDMLKLKSPDPNVVSEMVWDLGERGADLTDRNDLRTEWMAWEALKGSVVVPFPNAASVTIDYGIPVGHFQTFGVPWTTVATADPIEDLWTLGAVGLSDAGIYLGKSHFNISVYRLMRRNAKILDALSSYGRNVMLPTDQDVRDLLREGSDWEIVDEGYLPEGQTNYALTKWIPDGKILQTTRNYKYAGRRIGEVLDGWVLVGVPGQEQPVARQGRQSEWIYNRIGQQTLLRVASARVPRLVAPEAIAWGTAF